MVAKYLLYRFHDYHQTILQQTVDVSTIKIKTLEYVHIEGAAHCSPEPSACHPTPRSYNHNLLLYHYI